MSDPAKLVVECLLNGDWTGWRIEQVVEVFDTNDDGRRAAVLGYFRDETVAWAFVGEDASHHRNLRRVLVFTNGKRMFILDGPHEEVKFFDEEVERHRLRSLALAKLTEQERELLGLPG